MRRLLIGLAVLATGCGKAETPDADAAKEAEPATPVAEGTPEPAEAKGTRTKLLEWLDPDAVAVVYTKLPASLDLQVFSVVFALPPKVEKVLTDTGEVMEALEAVLPPDGPTPDDLLGDESLAMASMVAAGTYVLKPLERPRGEVEATLEKAGLRRTDVDGYALFVPERTFPWKVAFVSDDVVAFIPIKEIGSGLTPLTAGRDLPPSDIERQLTEVFKNEPSTILEVYAAGPLLHLDMGQEVIQLMVQARPFQGKGIDVQLRLQPTEHAPTAATALTQREAPLENDQVQALMKQVAFTPEGPVVNGRLQLTPDDVAVLSEAD